MVGDGRRLSERASSLTEGAARPTPRLGPAALVAAYPRPYISRASCSSSSMNMSSRKVARLAAPLCRGKRPPS